MKILNNIDDPLSCHSPLALTIGNFDGVHLGHQAIINELKKTGLMCTVMTFTNHPSDILHGKHTTRLTTLNHRLSLFESIGVDVVILLPFTKTFSEQSSRAFLTNLKQSLPFTHLTLGHDSVIGCDRNNNLYPLSRELSFTLNYLEPVLVREKIISSSQIRKYICNGQLQEACESLGRSYSIKAIVTRGQGLGRTLGFQTANLSVEELTLPPLGVYAVEVILNQETLPAIANLGHAPTLHQNRSISLEIHILDKECSLYDQEIEVRFIQFLRPEKKFDSPAELKTQIAKDIAICRKT